MRTMMAGLAAATMILAGCGKEPDKAPDPAPASTENFAASFDASFTKSCVSSATNGGVSQAQASAVCGCVLDKVNEQFSNEQKQALKQDQLRPLAEECSKG